MLENYNIFYIENTQAFLAKFEDRGLKGDFYPFLSDINKIKNSINGFIPVKDLYDKFSNNNFFLIDLNTLFLQSIKEDNKVKDISSFLNIKETINYLYKMYSAPYCKDCNQKALSFNLDILKDFLKQNLKKQKDDFMLCVCKSIKEKNIDELTKNGIGKAIVNNIVINIASDTLKNDTDEILGILKTLKITNETLEKENKLESVVNFINDKSNDEFLLVLLDSNKKVIDKLILSNNKESKEYICPKCHKKFKPFSFKNTKDDYIYEGILYSDIFTKSLNAIFKQLEGLLNKDFEGKDVINGVYLRLENIFKFNKLNFNFETKITSLTFYDYFLVILGIILETLPKNITLVIKDILDYFDFKDREEILKKISENFNKACILSKNNLLDSKFNQAFIFKDLEFFILKEKCVSKKIKYVGEVNNLYKKIVKLFLNSYDVKASNLKESDFSIAKLNLFLDGKIESREKQSAFLEYRVLNKNFYELANYNLFDLKNIFIGFKDISNELEKLCDLGLDDAFLLSYVCEFPRVLMYL